MKQSQIDRFYKYIGGYPGNARDAQPLNGRAIKRFTDAFSSPSYAGMDGGSILLIVLGILIGICGALALFRECCMRRKGPEDNIILVKDVDGRAHASQVTSANASNDVDIELSPSRTPSNGANGLASQSHNSAAHRGQLC